MAAAKRKGLGKGLDSLIPKIETSEPGTEEAVKPDTFVKISRIEPNKNQPRKKFDEDALQELSESIKQFGVIQPLIVQKRDDYYEIIAGERRWRAAKLAGLKEVPVIIKNYTDQEIMEISLIENIQRENLNPIEEAQAYKRLLEEFGLKQDEVAERVAKSRTAVTNSMRLLKLDDRIQQMVIDEMITTGHARALLAIADPALQLETAKKCAEGGMTVRAVEKLAAEQADKADQKVKKSRTTDQYYKEMALELTDRLQRKVSVTYGKKKGTLVLEFYDKEDLAALARQLTELEEP